MSNVIEFSGETTLDIDPDRVITSAAGKLKEVTIIGYDNDGELYFASSQGDAGNVLWHLEKAKQALLEISK